MRTRFAVAAAIVMAIVFGYHCGTTIAERRHIRQVGLERYQTRLEALLLEERGTRQVRHVKDPFVGVWALEALVRDLDAFERDFANYPYKEDGDGQTLRYMRFSAHARLALFCRDAGLMDASEAHRQTANAIWKGMRGSSKDSFPDLDRLAIFLNHIDAEDASSKSIDSDTSATIRLLNGGKDFPLERTSAPK